MAFFFFVTRNLMIRTENEAEEVIEDVICCFSNCSPKLPTESQNVDDWRQRGLRLLLAERRRTVSLCEEQRKTASLLHPVLIRLTVRLSTILDCAFFVFVAVLLLRASRHAKVL